MLGSMAHPLLSCPGFGLVTNVMVEAGTSCPNILNPALMQPGWFEPQVCIGACGHCALRFWSLCSWVKVWLDH